MDPLTHSVTGIFLGRAGLNRFCEQAPWILVLAANAPDIDIVTLFGGSLTYLHYHRHLTHSLAALPVMALLPVLAVRLFTRKPFRWLAAYGISFVAVVSHLLLDYTNIYGIRFLLPFSGRWFRLDLTGCGFSGCGRNSIRPAGRFSKRPSRCRLPPPPTARRSSATSSISRNF